jgi:membrane complex biogenesis BtpA family protein
MSAPQKDLLECKKPVIAMAHVPALPGTSHYDEAAGISGIIEKTRPDVQCLVEGGFDAIMFCNEDDRPYTFRATMEQVAAFTRVVAEVRPANVPFGVDFLWDPVAAMCIAAATGASFIREVLTGVYESDMGIWAPGTAAEVLRVRRSMSAKGVRVFFNIAPEFGSPLGSRSVAQRARSAVVSSLADAILISGEMAGAEPDLGVVRQAKEGVGNGVPVFVNTGAKASNIAEYLEVADGVIVGSDLKVEGLTWNPVDPARVRAFMEEVKGVRRLALGKGCDEERQGEAKR